MSLQRTPPKGVISASDPDLSIFSDDLQNCKTTYRKRKVPENEDSSVRELRRDLSASMLETREELMNVMNEYRQELKNTLDNFQQKMMASMKDLLTKQNDTIEKLYTSIGDIKSQITDIKHTNNTLLCEQNSLKTITSDLKQEVETSAFKIETLEKQLETNKKSVTELTTQLQSKEQLGRMNNLEISGVPLIKGENLYNIINRIAAVVGFILSPSDIDYIHRVRRYPRHSNTDESPAQTANIIVRFTQKKRKMDMLASIRARRNLNTADLNIDGPAKPIFINDHLAPHNKQLYGRARKLGREYDYKFIWLNDSRIFVRKNETSKAILILSENDLTKIK
ncbi:uncharacterized protein LOC131853348 [Achroia grisella]|uniref:uncharacterized protein LOC131853348 n=1 Tax=Achroia grisella TaxID=688607 RepID=UPI0027D2C65B|nr:uncharacterized protein LOC131853348 [Achroia grisella]